MLDFMVRDLVLGLLMAVTATEPAAEGDGIFRGKVARAGLEAATAPPAGSWPAHPEAPPEDGTPTELRQWAIRRASQDTTTIVKVYANGTVGVFFGTPP